MIARYYPKNTLYLVVSKRIIQNIGEGKLNHSSSELFAANDRNMSDI